MRQGSFTRDRNAGSDDISCPLSPPIVAGVSLRHRFISKLKKFSVAMHTHDSRGGLPNGYQPARRVGNSPCSRWRWSSASASMQKDGYSLIQHRRFYVQVGWTDSLGRHINQQGRERILAYLSISTVPAYCAMYKFFKSGRLARGCLSR